MAAMKQFFGLKEGQSAMQFGQEIKELSYEERMDFYYGLQKQGIDCEEPLKPKVAP